MPGEPSPVKIRGRGVFFVPGAASSAVMWAGKAGSRPAAALPPVTWIPHPFRPAAASRPEARATYRISGRGEASLSQADIREVSLGRLLIRPYFQVNQR